MMSKQTIFVWGFGSVPAPERVAQPALNDLNVYVISFALRKFPGAELGKATWTEPSFAHGQRRFRRSESSRHEERSFDKNPSDFLPGGTFLGWRAPLISNPTYTPYKIRGWLVLSDEQMSKKLPLSPLNDEQMSNWLGVEHLPGGYLLGPKSPFKGFRKTAFSRRYGPFALGSRGWNDVWLIIASTKSQLEDSRKNDEILKMHGYHGS